MQVGIEWRGEHCCEFDEAYEGIAQVPYLNQYFDVLLRNLAYYMTVILVDRLSASDATVRRVDPKMLGCTPSISVREPGTRWKSCANYWPMLSSCRPRWVGSTSAVVFHRATAAYSGCRTHEGGKRTGVDRPAPAEANLWLNKELPFRRAHEGLLNALPLLFIIE